MQTRKPVATLLPFNSDDDGSGFFNRFEAADAAAEGILNPRPNSIGEACSLLRLAYGLRDSPEAMTESEQPADRASKTTSRV